MTVLSGDEIYAAYREKVLAYLTARTECREDAEDLCAEVFAEVIRCLDRYDPEKASLSTWIYQITRFTFIDHLRKKRPFEPLGEELAEADDLTESLINKETLERLASALQTLKREERDIIVLRYYKKMSLSEISRLTGISYGMVKVRHKGALRALRDILEPGGKRRG
ncbi:MAG: sigma-70 family RNA polymerase sigma factor [Clostridia bacterium]|nr:sigma-70 family RNA polymerase sigma factor [Clostridia bacterium]